MSGSSSCLGLVLLLDGCEEHQEKCYAARCHFRTPCTRWSGFAQRFDCRRFSSAGAAHSAANKCGMIRKMAVLASFRNDPAPAVCSSVMPNIVILISAGFSVQRWFHFWCNAPSGKRRPIAQRTGSSGKPSPAGFSASTTQSPVGGPAVPVMQA